MAQTAIEMLAECLRLRHKEAYDDLYEDIESYYKKIEKQQIIDAFKNGDCNGTFETINAEQYYNETFNK